jgi:hypothetical protein
MNHKVKGFRTQSIPNFHPIGITIKCDELNPRRMIKLLEARTIEIQTKSQE